MPTRRDFRQQRSRILRLRIAGNVTGSTENLIALKKTGQEQTIETFPGGGIDVKGHWQKDRVFQGGQDRCELAG